MKVKMIIQGTKYEITRETVLRVAEREKPDKIRDFYIEVRGKQFPPKQLIRLATGTSRSFNSSNARSVLTKLGFAVKAVR